MRTGLNEGDRARRLTRRHRVNYVLHGFEIAIAIGGDHDVRMLCLSVGNSDAKQQDANANGATCD